MKIDTFDYAQGSPEWLAFRINRHGASEAAAMLGLSKHTTRAQLIHMKHTGMQKEFSDWVQANVLDKGHEVEAMTRPIIEKMIGRKLHPLVYADAEGNLSASVDGITMTGDIAWENKQYNQEYYAMVMDGAVPPEHMPQCQQILMLTGADKLIFSVSDGTEENTACVDVLPDQEWFSRLIAGWAQLDIDKAAYQPPEYIPAPQATPTMDLPAVSIQIQGQISLISNLQLFGDRLNEFVESINQKPETDQDFADAEAAIKILGKAEDALEAAMQSGLAQTASVDEMCRTVKLHKETARTTRLMLEKLVKIRKESIRTEEIQRGKDALSAHIATLNTRLGNPYMPIIPADFAGAIKGKKSIASIKEAIDTAIANAKIDASQIADKIQVNLNSLRDLGKDHQHLFHDAAALVSKANDDLVSLIKVRIAEYEAAEAKKAEDLRERIRQEEEAKAKAKLEAEAKAKADEEAKQARIAADIERAKELNRKQGETHANEKPLEQQENQRQEPDQQATEAISTETRPTADELVKLVSSVYQIDRQTARFLIIKAAEELTAKQAA